MNSPVDPALHPLLLTERRRLGDAQVAWLILNRPDQLNALSEALLDALTHALHDCAADATVRAIVIAARGRAFCAGHDLREMRAQPSAHYYQDLFARCTRLMMAIQRAPQPVLARVHGIATAAGCQLVGMCDLAVASADARFATSGINYGLFCATPSVALSRNVSRKQAFEMLFTGDFVDARRACELGLINRVVAPDALDGEIEQLLAHIVGKPEFAMRLGKDLFYRQLEMGIEGAYQLAAQTMACNMMDASALEGVQAFLDKRQPNWPAG